MGDLNSRDLRGVVLDRSIDAAPLTFRSRRLCLVSLNVSFTISSFTEGAVTSKDFGRLGLGVNCLKLSLID